MGSERRLETLISGGPKKDDIKRLRKKLGWVNADPGKDLDEAYHARMLKYGIDKFGVWGACPAQTSPKWIVRYVSWLEPAGNKPLDRDLAFNE